jgi:chemotaxis protein MotB
MNDNDNEDGAEEEENEESSFIPRRRYKRRLGDNAQNSNSSQAWLISFTDVMALMLTFFVLLFAMSKPETQNWADVSSALQMEFNKFYGSVLNRGTQDAIDPNRINFDRALDIIYLKAVLESVINDSDVLQTVTLIPQRDSLIISLPRDLIFNRGSSDVSETGARAIYALGGTLSRIKNKIEVIGHADPNPLPSDGLYSNNWELSLARASKVAALLNNVGYERDIVIRGLSSGRYFDLMSTIQDAGIREELSRRVDIMVMNHDGRRQKVFFAIDF